MNCELCDSELKVCRINPSYYECVGCKTQISIKKNISLGQDFYTNSYLQNMNVETKTLILNKPHYIKLFNHISKKFGYINFLKDIDQNSIIECHCYGGGFPQIESMLPVKNIIVYDFIADVYEKNIDVFENIFNISDKNIIFKPHDLTTGIVIVDNPIIVSLIHILEHFTIDETKRIFEDLNNNLPNESYILIYQPNISRAKTHNWCHYIAQHLTFIPLEKMMGFLNSFSNLDVKYDLSFSDDFLIICKVNKD